MKNLTTIVILVLFSGITFGQKIKTGNTAGVHSYTIELSEGVSMEQAQDFLINTFIPAWEKHTPGIKSFFTKGVRGENKGKFGWINLVESEDVLRKYANDDGSQTELAKSIREKMKAEWDEYNRLFKIKDRKYTTWLVL